MSQRGATIYDVQTKHSWENVACPPAQVQYCQNPSFTPQNTSKLQSGNSQGTTRREQAKPNPIWHSGGGFDTRTSTPVPKSNYHTQWQQLMDRRNPARG